MGLPGGSDGKRSACSARDSGLTLGSPKEENDYPLSYSYLENYKDIGVWPATVHGVAKSQTQLSVRLKVTFTFTKYPESYRSSKGHI